MKMISFKKILMLSFFAWMFFGLADSVQAATYYVTQGGTGAKDGSYAAPSAVATFNAGTAPYDDLSDDTVYFLDSFTTVVTVPVGGSSADSPVTLRGDYSGRSAVINGGGAAATCFDINSKNYVTVDGFEVTNCTTDGFRVRGSSQGIIARNIYSHAITTGGAQAFQTEGTAQVDYYDIQGDDCADDGFSIHGTPTVNIYTGSFSGNDQGVNMIEGPTFYGEDITITNATTDYIYVQGYHPSYLPEVAMEAEFRNIILDGTGGAAGRGEVIRVNGQYTTFTLRDVTIRNMPTFAANTPVIRHFGNGTDGQGATSYLYGVNIAGNGAAYGVLATADGKSWTIDRDSISGKSSYISDVTEGVKSYTASDVNIKRTKFSEITGSSAVAVTNPTTLTIDYNTFFDLSGSYYAVNSSADSTLNVRHNTDYNSSAAGRGVYIRTGVDAIVKNNILSGLSYAMVCGAPIGSLSATYNVLYNNTSNFAGAGCTATQSVTSNPLLVSSSDFQLQYLSPAIDAGTDLSLTADFAGNSIYGLPDIGAYEYQPPYTMGTDEVDTSGDVRVYGDGKFRNTVAVGGTTANLSVDPASDDKSQYLDIDISTWETTGDYSKAWTENSTTITGNTVHTVGDLENNKYYIVTVDGGISNMTGGNCQTVGSNFSCLSNGSGEIEFTYSGGYSQHDFVVEEGDNTAPTITNITSDKANGTYEEGEVIDIDVTFSEAVTSTGNVTVTLETGTTDRTCTFTVSNSTTGTCNYTVQDGDESADLTVSSISGTIQDQTGNSVTNFTPTTNLAANKALVIDGVAPTITSITSDKANGSYATGEVIDIDVTFSEAVTSTGDVTVTLETGTIDRTCTFAVSNSTTGTCNYTVQDGDTSADLTVSSISGTIQDQSGNSMTNFTPTTNLAANKALVIDTEEEVAEEDPDSLEISKVKYKTTKDSIIIEWKTNNNADETIRYGTSKSLKKTKESSSNSKDHKIIIKNLKPNTTYYFRVKSEDRNDQEDRSKIYKVKTKKEKVQESIIQTFFASIVQKTEKDEVETKEPEEKVDEEEKEIPDEEAVTRTRDERAKDEEIEDEDVVKKEDEKVSWFKRMINFFIGLFQ
ncbi:fibronectin type III domain-containing protein [Patescibacteria group bacterium]